LLLKSNLVVWRVVVVCRSAASGASTEMLDIRSGPASEVGEVVKGSDVVVVRILYTAVTHCRIRRRWVQILRIIGKWRKKNPQLTPLQLLVPRLEEVQPVLRTFNIKPDATRPLDLIVCIQIIYKGDR